MYLDSKGLIVSESHLTNDDVGASAVSKPWKSISEYTLPDTPINEKPSPRKTVIINLLLSIAIQTTRCS